MRLGLRCATALLLSACGGGAAAPSPVKITLKVEDASLRKVGDACSGSGGYLYVRPGAAYEVVAGEQVLARGVLPPGVAVRRGANAIKGAAVEPTTCSVTFSVRLYSFTEIRTLLRALGFQVERVFGGYDGAPLSLARSRTLVVAAKPAR